MRTDAPGARYLPYETALNFRDVGGYRTRDGRVLRRRRLFRSGALHLMSEADAASAHAELGLKSVFDLRRPDEIAREGDDLGPLVSRIVRRQNLSIIPMPDPQDARASHDRVSRTLDERYGRGPSGGRYAAYLEIGAGMLRELFRALAREDSYPAVVHCSAGKDRTGVACALLLDVLGVDEETIVADYAASNRSTPRLLAWHGIEVADEASAMQLYGAPPEAMRDFLARLRGSWGDAASYLRAQGLEEAGVQRLTELLLERP